MTGFKGTDNKAVIRRSYDLPIIKSWSDHLDRPLAYLGLPGPHIEDLLEWQSCIEHATGIELLRKGTKFYESDLDTQRQLMSNVFRYGLSDRFELLRGFIESIILDGHDVDGHFPYRSYGSTSSTLKFLYTLVNLDFLGGIGYRSKKGPKRVQAIEKLFERQRGTDFLLLLTLNVRDKLGEELTEFLESENQQIYPDEVRNALSWYIHCDVGKKAHKLKAAVPLYMRHQASHYGFDCFCYPPVFYDGNGDNRMVHFAFKYIAHQSVFPKSHTQSLSETLNLVFLTAQEGQLFISDEQYPGFRADNLQMELSFLPELPRNHIVSQFAGSSTHELQEA